MKDRVQDFTATKQWPSLLHLCEAHTQNPPHPSSTTTDTKTHFHNPRRIREESADTERTHNSREPVRNTPFSQSHRGTAPSSQGTVSLKSAVATCNPRFPSTTILASKVPQDKITKVLVSTPSLTTDSPGTYIHSEQACVFLREQSCRTASKAVEWICSGYFQWARIPLIVKTRKEGVCGHECGDRSTM